MSNYLDTIAVLIVDLKTGITMTTMTTINWDDDDKTNSEDYPWRAVTRSEALASLRPRAKTRTAAELSTHHTALHTSPNSPLLLTHPSLLTHHCTGQHTYLFTHHYSPYIFTRDHSSYAITAMLRTVILFSLSLNNVTSVNIRPVHKSFLEFQKMNGRFMLHFDR